jgi:diguanylate cyclase (GGDEF)-like protein
MIIDIDLFKDINDKHGHLFGDTVISGIASQFLRDLRQIDLIGRYGGDEFIILLPETDLENATQVGERLRNNIIGSPYFKDSKPVHITISVGAASRKPQDESLEVIIERADQALYQAKEGGRNQIAAIP